MKNIVIILKDTALILGGIILIINATRFKVDVTPDYIVFLTVFCFFAFYLISILTDIKKLQLGTFK